MRLDPSLKKVYEDKEFLEATGGENEKDSIKVVNQLQKEEQVKVAGQRAFFLEKLDDRKKFNDYNQLCAKITAYYIEDQKFPKSVNYKVQYDTQGVLLFVNVGKRVFQRAFKSVRDPLYDLNACMVFAMSIVGLLNQKNGRTVKPE
jgi:hypothetical protein